MSGLNLEALTPKQAILTESLSEAFGRIDVCEDMQYSAPDLDPAFVYYKGVAFPCSLEKFVCENIEDGMTMRVPVDHLRIDESFRRSLASLLSCLRSHKSARIAITCSPGSSPSVRQELLDAFAATERIMRYGFSSMHYDGYVLQVRSIGFGRGGTSEPYTLFARLYPDRKAIIVREENDDIAETSIDLDDGLWADALPRIREAAEEAIAWNENRRKMGENDIWQSSDRLFEYGLEPLGLMYDNSEVIIRLVNSDSDDIEDDWLRNLLSAVPHLKDYFFSKVLGD